MNKKNRMTQEQADELASYIRKNEKAEKPFSDAALASHINRLSPFFKSRPLAGYHILTMRKKLGIASANPRGRRTRAKIAADTSPDEADVEEMTKGQPTMADLINDMEKSLEFLQRCVETAKRIMERGKKEGGRLFF